MLVVRQYLRPQSLESAGHETCNETRTVVPVLESDTNATRSKYEDVRCVSHVVELIQQLHEGLRSEHECCSPRNRLRWGRCHYSGNDERCGSSLLPLLAVVAVAASSSALAAQGVNYHELQTACPATIWGMTVRSAKSAQCYLKI